jgi:anti-sigma factor RsiW
MDCKTAALLLAPYLDGELDRATVVELEAHIDGCADCAAELSALDEIRQTLRKHAARYPAPASLRRRLEAAAGSAKPQRMVQRTWWMGVAASLLVAAAVSYTTVTLMMGAQFRPSPVEDLTVHDLIAGHLRALAAASPVDVVSTDRHTVKPWFDGRIASVPPVPDFATRGFALIGGRIDYVRDQRVAVVVYRHNGHLIDVYFLPPELRAGSAVPLQRLGYTLLPVKWGERSAWVVSDMDEHELGKFQRLLVEPQ